MVSTSTPASLTSSYNPTAPSDHEPKRLQRRLLLPLLLLLLLMLLMLLLLFR